MTDRWQVFKWMHLWIAKHGYRTFEADTWDEAMRYATNDRRDEDF